MKTDLVVKRLCRMPAGFYGGSKSMMQLMSESGIDEGLLAVLGQNIATYIRNHPELIEEWLRWSESKRVSSGWYFTRRQNSYVVGFHPKGETLNFVEPHLACAEFIVREVRAMIAMPRTKILDS